MTMDVKQLKFSILGSARSGRAAAFKIREMGGKVFLSEVKPESEIADAADLKRNFDCEFGAHSEKIFAADVLIVSPGIRSDLPLLKQAEQRHLEIIGEIEFAYRIKAADSKIIAITGSNGKSTTVSLIHHILKSAGYRSALCGNIGTAVSSLPIEKPGIDYLVMELSSFQLELIKAFRADVAAVLNITPDHLNRYQDMSEYAQAKFNIFRNQSPADLAVLNRQDEFTRKFSSSLRSEVRYFSLAENSDIKMKDKFLHFQAKKISLEKATLKGPHNLANIMASILSVSRLDISAEIFEQALASFQPLPHRLEFVKTINSVDFYNDSKATNTDSVKYALQSFSKPVRIIMGGAGKGEDYRILNPFLQKHAKKIYLMGESRREMATAFSQKAEVTVLESFEDAVYKAFRDSAAGDVILLSPGCTSFDMFKNFEERGDYFKKLVMELK